MDPYIGREILGQFRITEKLGQGGMGAVYKAEQPSMDRLAAVKILHPRLASRPDLVTRFKREARAMSRLTHPNTVRVFLYGELEMGGALYIVMEFLDGADLMRTLRREGPMETRRGARIMVQVCGALEEAHNSAIVHRDLKPENIVLTTQGGIPDFAKVLDFGLAKIRDMPQHRVGGPILTQQGMVFGTPEFMSPEQAQGLDLDRRTDIYSLGTILYEMLSGKLPFRVQNPMDYIACHIKTPPIPIFERAPDRQYPVQLWPVLARSLEKNPNDRYQTAAEFAAALEELAAGRSGAYAVVSRTPEPPDLSISDLPTAPRVPAVRPGPAVVPAVQPRAETAAEARTATHAQPATSPAAAATAPARTATSRGLIVALLAVIAVLLLALVILTLGRTPDEPPADRPLPPIGAPRV